MAQNKSRKTYSHSTISRRDFMRMLGLGSVGMGATALGLSAEMPFADLDEMMSSIYAERKLPFWVKEVDEPTVEIDWEQVKRFPSVMHTVFFPEPYGGEDAFNARAQRQLGNTREKIMNGELSIQDVALNDAGWYQAQMSTLPWQGTDAEPFPIGAWMFTPEQYGVPKYEGTPEEATRMIRVAARIFGAFDVGVVKLTEKTKKLLYQNVVFEDVDVGYEPDPFTHVLPNKDLWVIVSGIPQSHFMSIRKWGAHGFGYSQVAIYTQRLQTFLHGLGYQAYGRDHKDVGLAVPFGVLAGIGEYSRTAQMVSPHVGNGFRTVTMTLTDLPLAETKPIDAGILEFCKTCKKCAESCPSGALSLADEPEWIDASKRPVYHGSTGVKGYYTDGMKCINQMFDVIPHCNVCQTVCPFNKFDKASIHEVIKGVIGTTPIANKLIASLDDAFGYGLKSPEESIATWEMDPWDVPLYGLDTARS